MNSNIRVSENISELRRKKNITQEELAEFMGVTKASVSKWERGAGRERPAPDRGKCKRSICISAACGIAGSGTLTENETADQLKEGGRGCYALKI